MDLDTRKAKAELLKGREVRRMPTSTMECRSTDGTLTFRGVASSVESPYDMGFYTETMKRGAFDKTLAGGPDVQLLVNHEGLPLARTTNGSLTLRSTDVGLEFEARVSEDDPDAARIAAKVSSGLMDQCSFAFRCIDQDWNDDYDQRDIKEVSLDRGDVSIVNYGANPNTPITVRSLLASLDDLTPAELDELRVRLGIKREPIEVVLDMDGSTFAGRDPVVLTRHLTILNEAGRRR
jgi:HK97 family phage prohead protease